MSWADLGQRGKRWLILVHRWVGIVFCLLFLMWCVSGIVMVFVRFPDLGHDERMAGLPAIDWSRVEIGPAAAERLASPGGPARAIALEMIAGDPVWRIMPHDGPLGAVNPTIGRVGPPGGPETTLCAATGARLPGISAAQAEHIASAFARAPVAKVRRMEYDQWTSEPRYDQHRPLYRVRFAGPGARDLYISSTTGAVLQDTNREERFWNWIGSVPHWGYFTILSRHASVYRQVIIWVAAPCILVAITGIWIGLLRTRIGRRRYRDGRMTPFRGWMLWHHVAGLAGGLTLALWIFSGWLSVDPGHMFGHTRFDPQARAAFLAARPLPPIDPARLAHAAGADAKRVELFWAAGRPWVQIEGEERTTILDAEELRPGHLRRQALLAAAQRLVPGVKIAAMERLTAPDLYWYDLLGRPQLPVLRVKFADAAGTWVHLDPATGRLLGATDRRGRAYRWLYSLFHKWDLNMLTLNRPAWEAVMATLASIGVVISFTGIWIGWRRLRGL